MTIVPILASLFLAQSCDQTLWQHVYHANRLRVLHQCVAVTGVLKRCKPEPDGDLHCGLQLDPEFAWMVNARNKSVQHGQLVVEPICQRRVTQRDAIRACRGFKSRLAVPKIGSRVIVIGPYVLDTEANHGWNEIHPPTVFKLLP